MRYSVLVAILALLFLSTSILGSPAFAETDGSIASTEPEVAEASAVSGMEGSDSSEESTKVAAEESTQTATSKEPLTREKIDTSVRDFFDGQSQKLWQYMRPYILLRTGAIYEQWDETNNVYREAGFKLWHAKLGFKGKLDSYDVGQGWKLDVNYMLTGDFAGSVKLSDAYGLAKIHHSIFGVRLKLGVMKVPFLKSELVSDSKLIFFDRPQFVKPYGSKYLTDMVKLGMGREPGASLKLYFWEEIFGIELGAYSYSGKIDPQLWATTIVTLRGEFDSKDLIHDRVRLRLGGSYYNQEKLPLVRDNSRYAFSSDARLDAFGAFVGGEWGLQVMDDVASIDEYENYGYKNSTTWAMGYQVYAGYAFPKREYEIAVRYQWWDPDDTNIEKPEPQMANQALRWITVGFSWWPIDLVRLMANYTHKQELEAVGNDEYSEDRLKDVSNDTFTFTLQVSL